jgi:serine/threonine protein kinase
MDGCATSDKLGEYTILERLGKGGMGVVYRAHHDELGQVAIKLMPDESRGARGRLLREAAVAASLDHPHIIKVYGLGEHDRRPYIVMELLDGLSLRAMVRYGRDLPLEHRLELMKQVLRALAYAHDAGVAHRDIKPQNIFVTLDGSVRVLDFGLARADDSASGKTRGLVGTPAYMPPERLLGAEVDHLGDIFSAGTVFYELLSRSRAFTGRRPKVLEKIRACDPVPIHRIDERLPEELSTIVQTAMAKDPSERYQSMHELLAAVERFEITLAGLCDEIRDDIAAKVAGLGPMSADDPGPLELEVPRDIPHQYLELLALRQRMEEQREDLEKLIDELAWAESMLAAPLDQLDEETLQGMANRADAIREMWPREPRAAELGRRVLQELRDRLRLREPVHWGNAGRRPRT